MGPAAALVVAQAAFLLAPDLPDAGPEVAATAGVLLVCAVVLSAATLEGRALWLWVAGAVAAMSALAALDADAGAWLAGAGSVTVLPAPGDPLALLLPGWGDPAPAGRLGAPDAVFLGAFSAYTRRLGLRAAAGGAAMAAGLVAAVLLAPAPALALMAAGVLLANLDHVPRLARGQ